MHDRYVTMFWSVFFVRDMVSVTSGVYFFGLLPKLVGSNVAA